MGVPKVKTKDVAKTLRGIAVKTQRRNSHVQDPGINLNYGTVPGLCAHRLYLPLKICFNLLQSSNEIST